MFVLLRVHELHTEGNKEPIGFSQSLLSVTPQPPQIKMEDYVKILLLKILGQGFAVASKSLFGKGKRSIYFNKMHFPFNECKRRHRKGLKVSHMRAFAV